ncbi:hypothetical protein, partial [Pseudoflavonifractor phocaeensis]|uniref:hypothetical protein n=1 Tax=Pseudoflavonifractor phocaeensis TaxID=1870988 RepID=UPI001956A185
KWLFSVDQNWRFSPDPEWRLSPDANMISGINYSRQRTHPFPAGSLRKHSANVHFARLQGKPLSPMPPAGGTF